MVPAAVRPGRFHGGLKLDGHRGLATGSGIVTLPLSERYFLWLGQHHGAAATPCVDAGDTVRKGQIIARPEHGQGAPVHAPTSGRVTGFQDVPAPVVRGDSVPMLVIESDGEDCASGDLPPLDAWETTPREALVERIMLAGIVGLGGAVFPTEVKIRRAVDAVTLILNGAECEPYISCDDGLMREHARDILLGARMLLRALDSDDCVVAIERDKPAAIEAMEAALKDLDDGRIRLERIFSLYPAGGERQLIEALTGRQVPRGGLPQDIGLVCVNVGTAAAVCEAIRDGESLISRITTVTGPLIASPGNFRVRIGTPVHELVEAAGGYREPDARLLMGGPMMGIALKDDRVPVVKAMNCLLALPAGEVYSSREQRACIRCGDCADVCPARLLPQQMYWELRDKRVESAVEYGLDACIECGCCDVVCPSHLPLTRYFRHGRRQLGQLAEARARAEHTRVRFEARNARLAAQKAEREARLAAKREALEAARRRGDHRAAIDEIIARKKTKAADGGDPEQSD